MTDVGNDLAYEVPVDRVLTWVEGCFDRLAEAGAATTITQLPLASVEAIGEWRFRLYRTLFFPRCSIPLAEIKTLAAELNRELMTIAAQRKIPVIPVSDAWYGFDPIHIKRSVERRAWPAILSASRGVDPTTVTPRGSFWRTAYLSCLAPSDRTILGWRRRREQPCGRLADGTTIWLY